MKQNEYTDTNSSNLSKGTVQRSGTTIVTRTMEIPDRVKRDMSRNMGVGTGAPRDCENANIVKK